MLRCNVELMSSKVLFTPESIFEESKALSPSDKLGSGQALKCCWELSCVEVLVDASDSVVCTCVGSVRGEGDQIYDVLCSK